MRLRFFSLLALVCVWCLSVHAQNSGRPDNFYNELRRNFVPAPTRKPISQRQLSSTQWPELTENNAAQWSAFASDGALTKLSDNTGKVKVGSASLLLTTKSGGDTGVSYPASGAAHLNLTSKNRFVFWAYGYNTNSYGFRGNQPVVVLHCKGGSIRYEPSDQEMSNDYWRFYSIPLTGSHTWKRTDTGTPDLSDLLSLEIRHATWGDSFTVCYDGVAFKSAPDTVGTPEVPPPGVNPDVVSPRILLYCFDPIMENLGGVRQHQTHGWNDPVMLAQQSVEDFKRSSHGLYQPQIVETVLADEHPYFVDGFQHTDESFEAAWNVPSDQRDFHLNSVFDYPRFCRENNIVARIESGDIDEVWLYTAPIGGLWESTMVGDGAYWLNSSPPPIHSKRLFAIMSAGFERGVAETIHGFGHRCESLMARCYGGWQNDQATAWNKFTLRDQLAPGLGGVGTVHFPFNATADYDYANSNAVPSNADDWANYPNFHNTTRTFSSQEWLHTDAQRDYLNWWYSHMPHGSGVGPDGFLNNWWRYIADFNQFKDWDGNLFSTEGIPSVSISNPSNGSAVSGTVNITAGASVDGALGRVDFYVDGVYQATDTISPYKFAWDTTGMSGIHRLEAHAIELSAGNVAISTPVLVNVGDAPVPSFSVSDVSVLEGDDNNPQMTFTVTRTGDVSIAASVSYATSDGTATAGSDYTATSGTLSFEPGQTEQTVSVAVKSDHEAEADETFSFNLSAPVSAVIGKASATATIQNDDTAASVNDVTVKEGDASGVALFTVTLSPPVPFAVDVNYTTGTDANQPNAATPDDDFTPVSGVLHFAASQTSATISVPLHDDAVFEHDEQFFLDISGVTTTKSRGVGTIQNDDAMPTLSVKAPAPFLESNSNAQQVSFSVVLSSPAKLPVSVAYTTAPGETNPASAGQDYVLVSGILNFAPGEVEHTVVVSVQGDTAIEPDETFSLVLSNPTEAQLDATNWQGKTTILNDDTQISVGDITMAEGNSDSTAVFTVTLSPTVPIPLDITYATKSDPGVSAATPGQDYKSVSGTLHIEPNQQSGTIAVPVIGDTLSEKDESFYLSIAAPKGVAVTRSQATATLRNDDGTPVVSLKAPTPVLEGNSGTRAAMFTISLSEPSGLPVSIAYSTAPGKVNSATATLDYVSASGTLIFTPGQTSKTVSVLVRGDILDEADETFTLTLSNPAEAILAGASATATITDDDTSVVSVGTASVVEGNAGKTFLRFPVSMSLASSRPVLVSYLTGIAITNSARATANSDYIPASGTLTLAPGQTRGTIDVAVIGDIIDEEDEHLALGIKKVQGATAGTTVAEGVIRDDDAPARVTIGDITVTETNRTQAATFLVSLSSASGRTISLSYTTADGTARQGSDYTATKGTLVFAPGETQKRIIAPILGDLVHENTETFGLKLSGFENAQFARSSALCTILNDDK